MVDRDRGLIILAFLAFVALAIDRLIYVMEALSNWGEVERGCKKCLDEVHR
jgi:hypothetical protein